MWAYELSKWLIRGGALFVAALVSLTLWAAYGHPALFVAAAACFWIGTLQAEAGHLRDTLTSLRGQLLRDVFTEGAKASSLPGNPSSGRTHGS